MKSPAEESLTPSLRAALCSYLLAWADDELILGHRDSEWTGFAPMLEEDIAFSSIAQDELGHAALIYKLITTMMEEPDLTEDHLALRRPAEAYCHASLLERPNGDWAFTIVRHYLYDLADACRVEALTHSAYAPLAAIARIIMREEHYHVLHQAAWWERLSTSTRESRDRVVAAVSAVVPLVIDVFGTTPNQDLLVAASLVPDSAKILSVWRTQVAPLLNALDPALESLLDVQPALRSSRSVSTDFAALHAEMTMVSAAGIGEKW